MNKIISPYTRRFEILNVLNEYGCLSTKGLQIILNPPMSVRNIQKATKRLVDHGLISKRMDKLPANAGNFYQIRQTKEARIKISKILNVDPMSLWQPSIRAQDVFHSEDCAIFNFHLKNLFPSATVVREIHFNNYPTIIRSLFASATDLELRPDLMLLFPKNDGIGEIKIGIEIEKTRKSNKRLLHKLKKLSMRTKLDGVIYISTKDHILEILRNLYTTLVLKKSLRIKHYGNNFILFSDGAWTANFGEPKMYNTQLENISLISWVHLLANFQIQFRRDEYFKHVT